MRSLLALAATIAFAAPLAASAADAPAPANVLRTLVYDVTYTAHTTHEVKSSGFNSGYGGGGGGFVESNSGVAAGSGATSQFMNGDDHGKLTINVVAAPADGGLVVDTAFAGSTNVQPTTRVAIFKDGRMSVDPAHPLAPETARLLPLIARGFIADRDVSAGSTWSVPAPAPAKGSTTYKVQSSDGHLARIAMEGVVTVPGPTGFDESSQGVTTYATDVVSPVSYDVTARIRRQLGIDQLMTTNAHLTATLVSDTMAKK